jgi:hypothetical protein
MQIRIFRTVLVLFWVLLGSVCKADEFIIVKGKTQARIIIGKKASAVERYAADELQRAIRMMTGAMLSIVNAGSRQETRIVIGTPVSNDLIFQRIKQLKLDGTNEEQIAVLREGHVLYIAGKTPRAALYATYTFLEDVLGVRWLWPGDTGEFLPAYKNIVLSDLFISSAPGLPIRSLAITDTRNGDPDTDTWMARNRMNVVSVPVNAHLDANKTTVRRQKGFLTRIAGHNIVLPDSLLQLHPEYIAQIGGKREFQQDAAHQLCWSREAPVVGAKPACRYHSFLPGRQPALLSMRIL